MIRKIGALFIFFVSLQGFTQNYCTTLCSSETTKSACKTVPTQTVIYNGPYGTCQYYYSCSWNGSSCVTSCSMASSNSTENCHCDC
jgi:hypothetical protein